MNSIQYFGILVTIPVTHTIQEIKSSKKGQPEDFFIYITHLCRYLYEIGTWSQLQAKLIILNLLSGNFLQMSDK